MTTNPAANAPAGSFLLELLQLAGWHLQVRDSDTARIRARRGEVELEVTGASLAEAVGTVFARAMRSNRSYRGR
jgi:hypothetical protein